MKIRIKRQADEGIALVITLIMLAVTLVMAVAFLAISTRERGSVTTSTDANHARLATDAALAHAEGQIIANMLSTTNPYNFDLLVSTNFINRYGYNPAVGANPTNVNYDYTSGGGQLTLAEAEENIANLEYLPRAPVFVPTNTLGLNDFRFYLDLNRNRQFDDTGMVTNWMFINGTFTTNGLLNEIGDPQWIGVLEHPDQPHGPLNRFIARYAFIAVPVGNTLDVNAIYNDALMPDRSAQLSMKPGQDGFLRNEGVGSWEINLAAFLTDLNTNQWGLNFTGNGYNYNTPIGGNNAGAPFEDALAILRYRYNTNILSQQSIDLLYTNFPRLVVNGVLTPGTVFKDIDNYSIGPLMTNNTLPYLGNAQTAARIWAGADNTNHFFSLADFFNPNVFRPPAYNIPAYPHEVFPDRLLNAGTNIPAGANQVPTYDRYTYYRLLSQLGTESEPQVGKININYTNVDAQGDVQPVRTGNLVPWTNSLAFFTLAADTLLRNYTTNWYNNSGLTSNGNFYAHYYFTNTFGTNTAPFGLNKIPVYVGGQFAYTPAVHRLLQLAANIYDATTNCPYPTVFRPIFTNQFGNVYIIGYTNVPPVNGLTDPVLKTPINLPDYIAGNYTDPNTVNIYGVPWIIGAKKGLPNFNELYVLNSVQVSRLVQVTRSSLGSYQSSNYKTNQMFVMSVSNSVGLSMWNSYDADFVPPADSTISVYMHDQLNVGLTNGNNTGFKTFYINYVANGVNYWPGSKWSIPNAAAPPPAGSSFFYTNWSQAFLPPSVYQYPSGLFVPVSLTTNLTAPPSAWQTGVTENYPFPQFGMMTTNFSQAYILVGSGSQQHVVDYVQFGGPNRTRNLTTELADPNYVNSPVSYMWSTNTLPANNPNGDNPYGLVNQIQLSRGALPLGSAPAGGRWSQAPVAPGVDTSPQAQQAAFGGFFTPNWRYNGQDYVNTNAVAQAPYTPSRTTYDYTLWQANDPLVHYLASDLNYIGTNGTSLQRSDSVPPTFNITGLALNQIGKRYQPWGLQGQLVENKYVDTNPYNLAYKDPLVLGSDSWQFPTNLFPSIGWLGRVHRGTPWQTVYLKSPNILTNVNGFGGTAGAIGLNTWLDWSGDGNINDAFDAINNSPAYDRWLFDLFTAGPNQNATLGQLSVNQTHLAAWSAVFSGIPVYTNLQGTNLTIFQPAGTNGLNSNLGIIWNSIQQTRSDTNQFRQQSFAHLGDVLAAPALTDQSPFLTNVYNNINPTLQQKNYQSLINDQMYEWLPQETMGLLKLGTPRYVIYCYAQALKPAQNGILAGGTYALMCTNYTVVSESAVRAVVEIQGATGSTPHVVLKNVNPLPPDQ